MNYICKFGLVHDKPCVNTEPKSNNGWIYSAIARYFRVELNMGKITNTFHACAESLFEGNILINRLPGKRTPPLSHDEILGMYLLGMIDYKTLKSNHFVFHGVGKPLTGKTFLNAIVGVGKLLAIGWVVGERHRNHFWEFKVKEMNQLAFRLNPAFIYFLKVDNGVKPHNEEKLAWKLYVKTTIESGSAGERNILFQLASKIRDTKVTKRMNPLKDILEYFGPDHIISLRLM